MQRHWVRHGPPVHMAVALYLGLSSPKPSTGDRLNHPDDLANFLRAFPGAAQA